MEYLRKSTPFSQLAILLGLMVISIFVFSLLMVPIFPAISGGYTITQAADPLVMKQPSFLFATKIVQFLYTFCAFMVPGLLVARFVSDQPSEYLGLKTPFQLPQLFIALLIMLCALPLVGLLMELNQTWNLPKVFLDMEKAAKEQTEQLLAMRGPGDMLVNLVLLALMPAIAEEIMFRGVMQKVITQIVKNGWLAVVITAVIFSAIHMQFLGFMPRALLGFLLGAIFLATGNLWLSIAAHFLNNGLQVVLVYLYQARLTSYDATKDDHVPLYFGLLSAAVTGLLIWRLYTKNRQDGTLPQLRNNIYQNNINEQ